MLQKLMLVKLASDVHLGNVRSPRKCLNSAAGELKSRGPKWIIDIDDMTLKEPVLTWLDKEFNIEEDTSFLYPRTAVYFHAEIPTVQGCHLIVKPFSLKKFSESSLILMFTRTQWEHFCIILIVLKWKESER